MGEAISSSTLCEESSFVIEESALKAREKNTGCSVRESESMTLVRGLSRGLVLSSKMTRNVVPSTSVVNTKSETSSEILRLFASRETLL